MRKCSQWGSGRAAARDRGCLGEENAEALTFPENVRRLYDRLRHPNVTPYRPAPAEAHRVLGSAALLLPRILHATWPASTLYDRYSSMSCEIGKHVARDEESYRYLVESIRPTSRRMDEFKARITAAGFGASRSSRILAARFAIHSGWRFDRSSVMSGGS
jgi:demethylmenaquinone methyltransferase/2-methoxy-6-polyprenyl-1,4-benzoquinol methylase